MKLNALHEDEAQTVRKCSVGVKVGSIFEKTPWGPSTHVMFGIYEISDGATLVQLPLDILSLGPKQDFMDNYQTAVYKDGMAYVGQSGWSHGRGIIGNYQYIVMHAGRKSASESGALPPSRLAEKPEDKKIILKILQELDDEEMLRFKLKPNAEPDTSYDK